MNVLVASDEELLVFNTFEILSSQLNQERSPRQAFLSWHSIEPVNKINASNNLSSMEQSKPIKLKIRQMNQITLFDPLTRRSRAFRVKARFFNSNLSIKTFPTELANNTARIMIPLPSSATFLSLLSSSSPTWNIDKGLFVNSQFESCKS